MFQLVVGIGFIVCGFGFFFLGMQVSYLLKTHKEHEQMLLDGVWLLKKHIVKNHKPSFEDAEPAEIVG